MLFQEIGESLGVPACLLDERLIQRLGEHVPLGLNRARPAVEFGHEFVANGVHVDVQERLQPAQLGRLPLADGDEVLVLHDVDLLGRERIEPVLERVAVVGVPRNAHDRVLIVLQAEGEVVARLVHAHRVTLRERLAGGCVCGWVGG